MVQYKTSLSLLVTVLALSACGGGGDSSPAQTSDVIPTTTPASYHLAETYQLPYKYQIGNSVFVDENKLLFAGGESGEPNGARHDGHPAYATSAYLLDLDTGTLSEYQTKGKSGHAMSSGAIASGIDEPKVIKLAPNKYAITGGFQYTTTAFVLDHNNKSIQSYDTDVQVTDSSGLNTTSFFADSAGVAALDNGDFALFGFNNGLFGMDTIARFDANNSLSFSQANAVLTKARGKVDAYALTDGRILLVGGWDGSADLSEGSATRRAEIYDPAADTIQRVADYPIPKFQGQHSGSTPTSDGKVCVGEYTYLIMEDRWEEGCEATQTLHTDFHPDGYKAMLIAETTDGRLVYQEITSETEPYDDACKCKPYKTGTEVYVFEKNES
ncbi:Kelch repeat-containing protein [Photobacterium alginatilyticum]|uniref:5-methyltetrahydrofolate--homocysteine methyltransferase n=1 Tax=Photobacterium alginatilyticum TaxID=1775171 RepID=A0ABW9YKV5_9GAMM|nr:kelch repeat-containing protein [Photobacterium alginatilyticum]NBI54300.1 hypothetical protein [Photobacterium alginatilyticum]